MHHQQRQIGVDQAKAKAVTDLAVRHQVGIAAEDLGFDKKKAALKVEVRRMRAGCRHLPMRLSVTA